jgi:hypothetical protein
MSFHAVHVGFLIVCIFNLLVVCNNATDVLWLVKNLISHATEEVIKQIKIQKRWLALHYTIQFMQWVSSKLKLCPLNFQRHSNLC